MDVRILNLLVVFILVFALKVASPGWKNDFNAFKKQVVVPSATTVPNGIDRNIKEKKIPVAKK